MSISLPRRAMRQHLRPGLSCTRPLACPSFNGVYLRQCPTLTQTRLPSPLSSQSRACQQTRPFLTSFLPGGSSSKPPPRTLSASRELPYAANACFQAVADVQSYSRFLPFITRSEVFATDAKGYPVSATLTAGYGPTQGSYRSDVRCDEEAMEVTARSGRGIDWGDGKGGQHRQEGLFEFLDTVWRFEAVEAGGNLERTMVDLTIEFQLRSALMATLMSAVEGEVAKMMIEAFARRMEHLHGQRR